MNHYHLGINLSHDRAAAVVRDGEIVVAIQQERLDRKKHSLGFLQQAGADPAQIQLPHEAIHYCLDHCGITMADLASITANMPGVDHSPDILRRTLAAEYRHKVATLPSHHLAHAYSAYWPSGFERALVLVVDGAGTAYPNRRTESYTLYRAEAGELTPLHGETVASHLAGLSTLGFLYEYITKKAGFVSEAGPGVEVPEAGKLMGLAPYGGEQRHWHRWVGLRDDSYSVQVRAYDIFLEVAALEKRYDDGKGKPYLRPYLVDLAWKVQHELEEALLHIVGIALRETGLRRLCLAGGVALNSVANYQLYRRLQLDDIFTFPSAGDAGIAAGCALWAYATQAHGRRRRPLRVATLGQSYAPDRLRQALDKFGDRIDVEALTPGQAVARSAEALAKGHVIARFEGGSEYGPRALGHRSILADPTFVRMKDILNARVKFREAFRPFAPVIPLANVSEVFEQAVPSPFMLLVSAIKEEYHATLPAITHFDGTGRVQTVTAADNPYLHQLCAALSDRRGGPPVVLNTSFNVAGQPIVETPEQAIETFLGTDIDYLCLEDFWITKPAAPVYDYEQHLARVADSALPHGLPPDQPDVTDLMRQLDRAIFFNQIDGCPWTEEELAALSAEGARFKETSVLFPDTPFGGPLKTQLSDDMVMLLDPRGMSELIDLTGRAPVGRYSYSELSWLLAARYFPERVDTLRIEQRLTTREAGQRMRWATEQLAQHRLAVGISRHEVVNRDTPLPIQVQRTLEPFGDPAFSMRGTLAALRDILQKTGYDHAAVCTLLDIETMQRIEPTYLHYHDRFTLPATPLGDLIRLFLLRVALPKAHVEALFGAGLAEALAHLGVLIERNGQWASRLDLFCVDGLYIATDHRYMLLDEDSIDEDPVMYIGDDSFGLVNTAPRRTVGTVLDLCTGSGVQALVASRYARRVTGVDINPRAIRVARFNAQLNGIENVDFIHGDLYHAVVGRTFDTILANPPFVPSPDKTLAFRDGGAQGEDVLARIVRDASGHLAPDGGLHIVSDLADLDAYQAKLTRWWCGGAVDVLLLHTAARSDALFAVPHSHAPFGQRLQDYNTELEKWVSNFRNAGLRSVDFGYILIRCLSEAPEGQGTYYTRTIHNPAAPIYEQVDAYFLQRRLVRRTDPGELELRVVSGLRIHSEYGWGAQARRIELGVPGNPYYTTYVVSEDVLVGMENIARGRLKAGDHAHHAWVNDMIFKGILQLQPSGEKMRSRTPASIHTVPRDSMITEQPTKTTPTCLSSYIRR